MGDIVLNKAVMHILDKNVGEDPVLSAKEIFLDEEIEHFISGHFKKLLSDSDVKKTKFLHELSKAKKWVEEYENGELGFIPLSQELAKKMHLWNLQAQDSLSGDFLFADFVYNGQPYVGGIKLDYNASFIHHITYPDDVLYCGIIQQKTSMPSVSQTIKDGFVIGLKTHHLLVKEKKYHFDTEKKEYVSEYVLEGKTCLSDRGILKVITDTSRKIIKENYDDVVRMGEAKEVITQAVVEGNSLDMEELAEKIFEDEQIQRDFCVQVREGGIQQNVVQISESSLKKENLMQRMVTSEGIEIGIPVEHMRRRDKIEFQSNLDGTISITLKNLEILKEK